MSQTKPHASVPPTAKSNGKYFPWVFHVVNPRPAEFTRRFDPPFRMANSRGEGGVRFDITH